LGSHNFSLSFRFLSFRLTRRSEASTGNFDSVPLLFDASDLLASEDYAEVQEKKFHTEASSNIPSLMMRMYITETLPTFIFEISPFRESPFL